MKRNLDQMKILSILIVVGSEIKTWNLNIELKTKWMIKNTNTTWNMESTILQMVVKSHLAKPV